MSKGISVKTVISLILSRIGGVPLIPNLKTISEGSIPTKQFGFGSFSLTGLSGVSDVLGGANLSSVTSDIFQNPVGSLTDTLSSSVLSVTTGISTLSGVLDEGQISSLTAAVSNLGSNVTSFADLTNTISGVSIPGTESKFDFDSSSITGALSSLDGIRSSVPSNLLSSLPNLDTNITNTLTSITAPLNSASSLTSINSTLTSLVSNLSANPGNFTTVLNSLTTHNNTLTSLVDNSVSAVAKVQDSHAVLGQVGMVAASLESNSTSVSSFISSIVKPSALAQITTDLQTYTSNVTSLS
jgi:hypothetical protein